MELGEAIDKFKSDLDNVKSNGQTAIEVGKLIAYLDELKAQASASQEIRGRQHELQLAHYDAQVAQQREQFRAVMSAGKEAINAAIIINGGAAIALMAFLGNVATRYGHSAMVLLAYPMIFFGGGVLCGGLGFGSRYISQFLYSFDPFVRAYI